MNLPDRLTDAPAEVQNLGLLLAGVLTGNLLRCLREAYPSFTLDDPQWRDLFVGTLEIAAEKAREMLDPNRASPATPRKDLA